MIKHLLFATMLLVPPVLKGHVMHEMPQSALVQDPEPTQQTPCDRECSTVLNGGWTGQVAYGLCMIGCCAASLGTGC